jgi:hypothetical protein
VSVIVGGAIFFGAGVVCLALAVWKSRARSQSIAPATAEVRNNPAPRRVATTKVATAQPATATATATAPASAHRAPAQARESYYAVAPPSRAKGRPMGWYSVDGSLSDERFWDGRTWTARRQLVGGTWSPVPLAG